MIIPNRANFVTVPRAACDGTLASMEAIIDELCYVFCAVCCIKGDYVFTPFGHLASGNPYEFYRPLTE